MAPRLMSTMTEPENQGLFQDIFTERRGINLKTVEQAIPLAVEIAREGREERKIGSIECYTPLQNR
jgi:DNA integrity scanning protein DisA with diadenylate cyclase activity